EHGPAGKNLDVIDAIVSQFANDLPHFPWAVGFAVMQIPGQRNVGSQARSRASAAGNGHISAGDEHARADYVAAVDGVAQGDIDQGTVWSHITHGSETGLKRDPSIRHR